MQMVGSSQLACCCFCRNRMEISIEDAEVTEKQSETECRKMVLVAISLVVLVGIISITCVIYTLPRTDVKSAIDAEMPNYSSTSLSEHLRIHSRQEWGSHPPRSRNSLMHPTPLVVISDTVTPPCGTFWSCSEQVKSIQETHMENSLSDIGYNFLVGGDGSIYEGRGWDTTNIHTGFVRNCNIAISFIGTFVTSRPSKKQMKAVLQLLGVGVRLGKITADYKLLAMNQTVSGANPGPLLYSAIKQWPHHWIETEQDIGLCLNVL